MTRKLKVLGLALVAVFALGAVAAQSAFGAEEFFHAEKEKTVVTAENDPDVTGTAALQILEIEGGLKVECSKFKAEGTQTGTKTAENLYTSPSVTVRPEYSGSPSKGGAKCDSFLGAESVEVTTHECHYLLFAATTEEHAHTSVICPAGQAITITGGGLTLKITGGPENLFGGKEVNQNLKGVHYTSTVGSTGKKQITIKATVAGIHYTCEPEFTCFLAGVANTGNNAKYTGLSTAKGFEDKGGPGAETKGYTEGEPVGIWKE